MSHASTRHELSLGAYYRETGYNFHDNLMPDQDEFWVALDGWAAAVCMEGDNDVLHPLQRIIEKQEAVPKKLSFEMIYLPAPPKPSDPPKSEGYKASFRERVEWYWEAMCRYDGQNGIPPYFHVWFKTSHQERLSLNIDRPLACPVFPQRGFHVMRFVKQARQNHNAVIPTSSTFFASRLHALRCLSIQAAQHENRSEPDLVKLTEEKAHEVLIQMVLYFVKVNAKDATRQRYGFARNSWREEIAHLCNDPVFGQQAFQENRKFIRDYLNSLHELFANAFRYWNLETNAEVFDQECEIYGSALGEMVGALTDIFDVETPSHSIGHQSSQPSSPFLVSSRHQF